MQKFLLLLIIFLLGNCVFAFNIVYPKQCNVTVNAKSTFFIGGSDKPIKINGQNINLHSTGAFAYVVPLNVGINNFKIETDDECKLYRIIRPSIKDFEGTSSKFVKYDNIKSFYVTTDNAPLRSTPVDAGINRITHLQRNILLNADGEQNGFYRILLAENKFGWIGKTSVKECYYNSPAKLIETKEEVTDRSYKFTFLLDKTVPYEIIEGNPMILRLYNIDGMLDGTYIKEFPLPENFRLAGYKGKYIENEFIWEIRKPFAINKKKPLKNISIAIDAGHGGSELGAIGCLGDKEKDIVLDIAKNLEKELSKRGANVILTRSEDYYLGLKDRVDITNYSDSEIFISIHANALPDGCDPNKNSGTSVYYYYNQAKPLAETVLDTMTKELELNNDKVRQASFAVIRNSNALSILVEIAYLINPEDNAKLISPEFRKKCAKAIADGLEKYIIQE